MSKAHRIIAGLATALLASSLVACAGGGTIATVNGQAISKAAFDAKLEGSPTARQTLQSMVQEALITQYAKDNNIVVSDADVATREDQLKANFPNGSWADMLKSRGLSEGDVHKILADQVILDKAVGKGVTVSVSIKPTSAQVPVECVINSIGLVPKPSVKPKITNRSRGKHANRNTAILSRRICPAVAIAINKTFANPCPDTTAQPDRHNR